MPKDRAQDPKRQFKNDNVIDLVRTKKLKDFRTKMLGDSRVVPVPYRKTEKASTNPKLIAGPGWMGESD